MINRILVLGGGSAGFLAAISLKKKIPDLHVTVVHSKEMGVIGVGEATTFAFPNYLHGRLRIEPGEFHREAQPTWKLGIRFLNWGPRLPLRLHLSRSGDLALGELAKSNIVGTVNARSVVKNRVSEAPCGRWPRREGDRSQSDVRKRVMMCHRRGQVGSNLAATVAVLAATTGHAQGISAALDFS